MKTYVVLFLPAENLHLTKGVGMIPYTFHKLYGCRAAVACYGDGDYPYVRGLFRGLEIIKVPRYFKSDALNELVFIIKNARKIDYLQLYHREGSNDRLNFIYKLLNPKGKTFLKMDVGDGIVPRLEKDRRNVLKEWVRGFFIKFYDCIGVEARALHAFVSKYYAEVYGTRNVCYVPTGYSIEPTFLEKKVDWKKKENIILTVGRIGLRQKANEVLLEAVALLGNELRNWKVVLIGNPTPEFAERARVFAEKHDMTDRLLLLGHVTDRVELCSWYERAKIFCLTSRFEGSPNVLPEAGFFRDYIVSTDLLVAREMTENGTIGSIVPILDAPALAAELQRLVHNDGLMEQATIKQREHVLRERDWDVICRGIMAKFQEK